MRSSELIEPGSYRPLELKTYTHDSLPDSDLFMEMSSVCLPAPGPWKLVQPWTLHKPKFALWSSPETLPMRPWACGVYLNTRIGWCGYHGIIHLSSIVTEFLLRRLHIIIYRTHMFLNKNSSVKMSIIWICSDHICI